MNALTAQDVYVRTYVAALCALPVIAQFAPRFMGLGPPLIALIAYPGFRFVYGKWARVSPHLAFWAVAFPALMAASAIWAIDPQVALERAGKTLAVTLSAPVLFAIGAALDDKARTSFMGALPWFVAAAALICAADMYLRGPFYFLWHDLPAPGKRFNLSHLNRGVVVLILGAALALAQHKRSVIAYVALAAALSLVLYKTSSQSAQLALLLAGAFYVAFPARSKMAWSTLSATIMTLVLAAPWLAQFMFARFADMIAQGGWFPTSYMPARLQIWDFVSRRALESPLWGFGADATEMIKDFDSQGPYWHTREVLHPHNFAVEIWIEFGILGAALGALLLADILYYLRRMDPATSRALLAALVICLSVASTGYGLWQSWWIGTFCWILASAPLLITPRNPKS